MFADINTFRPMLEQLHKSLDISTTVHPKDNPAGSIGVDMKETVSAIISRLGYNANQIKFSKNLSLQKSNGWYYEWVVNETIGDTNIWGAYTNQSTMKNSKTPTYNRGAINLSLHVDQALVPYATSAADYYSLNPEEEIMTARLNAMMIKENTTYIHGDKKIDPLGQDGVLAGHKYRNGAYLTPQAYSKLEEVIDMRGAKLTKEAISEGVNVAIRHNSFSDIYGLVTPVTAIEGLNSVGLAASTTVFVNPVTNTPSTTYSQFVNRLVTDTGKTVKILPDMFITKQKAYGYWKINDPYHELYGTEPALPVAGTNVAASGVVGATQWTSSDAGSYYYAVMAVSGMGGRSRLTLINATPVTVADGQHVDLTFTSGNGATAENGYTIYRSAKNAPDATGEFYPLFNVTTTELADGYDGAAAGKVRDNNRVLAGTEDVILIQMESEDRFDTQILHKVEIGGASSPFNGFNVLRTPNGVFPMGANTYFYHAFGLAFRMPFKTIVFRNVGV